MSGGRYVDGRYLLSDVERKAVWRAADALPPLSDEALDGLAAVILDAREQRAGAAHQRTTAGHSTNKSAA